MKWRTILLSVLPLAVALLSLGVELSTQASLEHHAASASAEQHRETHSVAGGGNWEGSAQGVAYSEFNHRFAGLFVLLLGLAELGHALRYPVPAWTRLVLPTAFGVIGVYLLIWSDHEAWPIGSLSFAQTFSGHDPEIIQHKFYGVFGATVAVSETIRRTGFARHPAWAAPLVLLGLVGALLLFLHSHGHHPANHAIALHHALLGMVGMGAVVSSGIVAWASGLSSEAAKRWELAWALSVVVMGLQLLLYFE